MKRLFLAALLSLCAFFVLTQPGRTEITLTPGFKPNAGIQTTKPEGYPSLFVAGGCFWCVESEFRRVDGVLYTLSGYAGGQMENPTYEDVLGHKTGHREAVEVVYDPQKVSYRDLVDFFMTRAHDPTQADGQGPDIGFQYTSAIFYQNDKEKSVIDDLIAGYAKNKTFKNPVATKVIAYTNFYPAETYHQQYYEKYEKKNGQPHMTLWLRQQKENALRLFESKE